MIQATAESAAAETISIEHGPEGTSISIDDPNGLEILALILILLTAIFALLMKSGARNPFRRSRN